MASQTKNADLTDTYEKDRANAGAYASTGSCLE
jgi:hypothetical protein